jgi:hypothetical protein
VRRGDQGERVTALQQILNLVIILQKFDGRKIDSDPAIEQRVTKAVRPPIRILVRKYRQAGNRSLVAIVNAVNG